MPRTNTATYLQQHRHIAKIWRSQRHAFSRLGTAEQRVLHDYFMPTLELAQPELLERRKRLKAEQPSLPHRAGKAYVQLCRIEELLTQPVKKLARVRQPQRMRAGNIVVYGELLPEPNAKLLAKELFKIMKNMSEGTKADGSTDIKC